MSDLNVQRYNKNMEQYTEDPKYAKQYDNINHIIDCSTNILDKHKKYADQYGKNTIFWGLGLDKHKKYADQYGKNTIFWGLGLEHEVYLECKKTVEMKMSDFLTKWTRERYSIDYFSNYKSDFVNFAMLQVTKEFENHKTQKPQDKCNTIEIPLLLKSHTFTKMDICGNHETILSKTKEANPHFLGKTFLDILIEIDPEYFLNEENEQWMFDGDTIEFFTRNFYKVTLSNVLDELAEIKCRFENRLNRALEKGAIFQEYGPIHIMKTNHPFATYMSNPDNVAMFNNGTLHFNLTLPTELDETGEIKNWNAFEEQHRRAIRLIQWMEPILLAVYGSPDPFSQLCKNPLNQAFSAASQRCAISRYIGIGTYDTDKMPKGKILVKSVDEIYPRSTELKTWYREYYRDNGYSSLSDIGLDINFNKHYKHGIEIRFLDHIDDPVELSNICHFFIYLMDYSLDIDFLDNDIENPAKSQVWHTLLLNIMREGKIHALTNQEIIYYCQLLGIPMIISECDRNPLQLQNGCSVQDLYKYLFCFLENRYQKEKIGGFSSYTLPEKNTKVDAMISQNEEREDVVLSTTCFQRCILL